MSQLMQNKERTKSTLTTIDCENTKSLIEVRDIFLTKSGKQLKEEAKTQVEYYKYIAQLPKSIKSKLKYEVAAPGGVPRNTSFLKDASNVYESYPEFRDSLVVGLLKAAISRTKTKDIPKWMKKSSTSTNLLQHTVLKQQ
eukprot:13611206-Ditylum_brightwellii.AAC.1